MREYKRISVEDLKFSANTKGRFSGYGSVFGNVDSYGDVIAHGAFKQTLRDWEERGKLPPMLLQHGGPTAEDMLPIGVWLSMEENKKGLKAEGQLFGFGDGETPIEKIQLVYDGLKAGALDGLSIGFETKEFTLGTKPNEPRRTLTALDLWELSVVTFPANGKARVGNVKSMIANMDDEFKELKDFERFLREAGIASKKEATDLVSRFAKIARREASSDDSVTGLLEGLRAARQTIR